MEIGAHLGRTGAGMGEAQSPDEGVDVRGAELPMCVWVAARCSCVACGWLAVWAWPTGALDAGLGNGNA